VSNLTLKST